jgi:hypothetical protein
VSDSATLDAVREAGGPIEQVVSVFMLHPQTFEQSTEAGYPHPFAGYFAGRGGVLGQTDAGTVAAVFGVFEPGAVQMFWDQGVGVHGADGGARKYWEQTAEFAKRYLSGADGLDRLAQLGERVIESAPAVGAPLFAGWRRMPLDSDPAARALQVMFVLRELRFAVHLGALAVSGLTPVEAHMLNGGQEYTSMFGWPEPFADGQDKKERYEAAEEATDRRMAEIVGAALGADEAAELARLAAGALAKVTASVPPAEG